MELTEKQKKLAQVNGDILLSEKKLRAIQTSITQHQQTREKMFKETDAQITLKKKELETLIAQGKETQALVHLYTNTAASLYDKIEQLKQTAGKEKKEAEDAVKLIYGAAEQVQKAADDLLKNAVERERAAIARETLADETILIYVTKQKEVELIESRLINEKQTFERIQDTAKQALAKAQEVLDDITRQIVEKKTQVLSLDKQIVEKQEIAESLTIEAEMKLKEAESLYADYTKQLNLLDEKAIELNKRELRVSDRERTVGRAYRETVRRGGRVN